MEEIKEMQILKKKEIEEKIKKLKEITGNTEIAFDVWKYTNIIILLSIFI